VRPTSIDCSECGETVAVEPLGRIPTVCRSCAPTLYLNTRRLNYRNETRLPAKRKPCPDCGVEIGSRSNVCQSCHARRMWAKRNAGKEQPCRTCDAPFVPTKSRLFYCSRSCWETGVALRGQTCEVPWRECRVCTLAFIGLSSEAKRTRLCDGCARVKAMPTVYHRTCQHCTRPFTTSETQRLKFCSEECCRRAQRITRKAREKSARPETTRRVYFAYICERDRWRCHVCGKRVSIDHEAPHPLAPTRDHIIPLARGGTHEPANVKLAHYGCNSARGDRGGNEQLLLVG
jgi:hypothetical protein